MEELKYSVEAVLFAVGKKMHIDELSSICKIDDKAELKKVLQSLQSDYENREGAVSLVSDGDFWKLGVSEAYTPVIQNLGVETELTKSVMETLAVIAWKYPILQNDVIHIRTNKAYDHLTELEEKGFINRNKHGRTKTIRLTEKFFQYFDLPHDKAKNVFKDAVPENIQSKVSSDEEEIKAAEKLTEEIKLKEKQIAEELKMEKLGQQKLEAGLDVDEPEEYTNAKIEEDKEHYIATDEKTGEDVELETYGEKQVEVDEEKKEIFEDDKLEVYESNAKSKTTESDSEEEVDKDDEEVESKLKVDEKAVDEEVEKLLHPGKVKKKEEESEKNDDLSS